MRRVTVIQTRDGINHATEAAAKRYAEKIYGEALSRAAINLLQYPKYVGMQAALEAMLRAGTFKDLQALQADLTLETTEDA